MTRKDYVLLSDALKGVRPTVYEAGNVGVPEERAAFAQWKLDVLNVANALDHDSPRFDRDRFLKACGVES